MTASTAKRLGIVGGRYLRPLFHAWRQETAEEGTASPFSFIATEDHPGILAGKLRQGDLDAAFLSPIDFARDHAQYRIIPGPAAVSAGESGVIQLLFREQLRNIATVAIAPTVFSAEVVLAHIVLAEKYEVHPQFVPATGSIEEVFRRADAVLLSGDATSFVSAEGHPRLDLVDEWADIMEMPYVHGFWLAPDGSFTPAEMQSFIETANRGVQTYRAPTEAEEEWLAEHFAYDLHEAAVESLGEFLSMAYYHGVLNELVLPRFHEFSSDKK